MNHFTPVAESMSVSAVGPERRDACGRADDQDRSAGAGAVSDELPQETVRWILGQAVHAHRRRHQRHVVDDGADQPERNDDDVFAPDLAGPLSWVVRKLARASLYRR